MEKRVNCLFMHAWTQTNVYRAQKDVQFVFAHSLAYSKPYVLLFGYLREKLCG